ncbi:hypothetical protein Glove_117g460 [Diversispora epigaea]|uniref:AP complex mu/sigma subunit domain-containing protein n=1 Tax=Diversispora epigaea TaxID=1348612 RepID=A0A397J6R4_9GLOM|nr:hypothetical protein Glove_117g460 [Diversispora epigaea]
MNKQVSKQFSHEEFIPIILTPKYQLVHVYLLDINYNNNINNINIGYYVIVDALLVLEFLHRIVDILAEHFGDIVEISIKDIIDTVYQALLLFNIFNSTCNLGSNIFDPVTKDLGKIETKDRAPDLSESGYSITLDFVINMFAISGLKVDSFKLYNEGYKHKVN